MGLFMRGMFIFVVWFGALWFGAPAVLAAEEASATSAKSVADAQHKLATEAVAANAVPKPKQTPHFLEELVDSILEAFDIRSSGNTVTHYVIAAGLLVIALLLRRVVTKVFFVIFRRMASRTETTLDDKLFVTLETPVGALVFLAGVFAALHVLKLPVATDKMVALAATGAFSLAIFWILLRAISTVLDHVQQIAVAKGAGIASFMPWIKKAVITVFVVVGVLTILQSLGWEVQTVLAGLGLGGLAFALAAQDTLANVFGAIVVAVDQPFKLGETVKIGTNTGAVEDIGLRSTRIRLVDKSLMVIPNKTVAAETVTNLSRFTRRRYEQVIGLTYETTPQQMEEIVTEIRRIVTAQPEVDAAGVMVFFRDLNASSLDIWVAYECPDPDFQKSMRCKQRINLEIMRAVEARGLAFAFPSQTVYLAGAAVEEKAARSDAPSAKVRPQS